MVRTETNIQCNKLFTAYEHLFMLTRGRIFNFTDYSIATSDGQNQNAMEFDSNITLFDSSSVYFHCLYDFY